MACCYQNPPQDPSLTSGQTCVRGSTCTCPSTNSVTSVLNSVTPLGYMIASVVTGRPVVQQPGGGLTLGQAPVVTGQINIQSLVIFGIIGLVAYAFITRSK